MPTGLVHVYTGEGKGKTTAALGLASRALGRGMKVNILQLFKRDTGELLPLRSLGADYQQFKPLHPFFTQYSEQALEDLKLSFAEFWNREIEDAFSGKFSMVVIDELGPALSFKLMQESSVLEILERKPARVELVMTGRGFPDSIMAHADYVTDMRLIKHPFKQGIMARRGIEF